LCNALNLLPSLDERKIETVWSIIDNATIERPL
jgi:predicted ester cyclase